MLKIDIIRSILRLGLDKLITVKLISRKSKLSLKEARDIILILEREGYIEQFTNVDAWILSMRGIVLTHTTIKKEYSLISLKKNFTNFLSRVKEINTSDKFPMKIANLKVLSEYPLISNGHEMVIIYILDNKNLSLMEFNRRCDQLMKNFKGYINTSNDDYYVILIHNEFLKKRSHMLKPRCVSQEEFDLHEGTLIELSA